MLNPNHQNLQPQFQIKSNFLSHHPVSTTIPQAEKSILHPPASFKSFGQCTICLFIRFHPSFLHLLKELQSLDPWHWTHTAQDTNGSIVGHDIHLHLLQQVKGQGPTMGAGSDSWSQRNQIGLQKARNVFSNMWRVQLLDIMHRVYIYV